jgi:hypothetical protein
MSDLDDFVIVGSDEAVVGGVAAVMPLFLQQLPKLPRQVHVEEEVQDATGSSRKRTLSSMASDA